MKRSIWRTLILVLSAISSTQLPAQILQLPVDAFSQNSNLSHPTCRSLAFDQQGFLWVGTDHGLNRFDGYQFNVYEPSVRSKENRPWGRINQLLKGENHTLWVGTASGLFLLSTAPGISLAATGEPRNWWPAPVRALIADGNGGVFVASNAQLVHAQWDSEQESMTVTAIPRPQDHMRSSISCLALEDDSIWIGSERDLLKLNRRGALEKRLKVTDNRGAALPITSLLSTKSGLWIGAGGKLHFKPYKIDHIYTEDLTGLQDSNITSLFLDEEDNLWISSDGAGLRKLDLKTRDIHIFSSDQLQNNLPDQTLYAIIGQDDGLLWMATQRAGLVRLQYGQNRFERYIVEPYGRQNDRGVTAICEDPLGNLWIGNQDGLVRQDATTGSIIHFFNEPGDPTSLPGDTVQSILAEANGTLWIGTYRSGLARLTPGASKFERFEHMPGSPSGLPSNQINALAIDSTGTVWIGTRTGLVHFNQKTLQVEDWVNPKAQPGDPPLYVTALAPSLSGRLWFGTYLGFGHINRDETQLYLNPVQGDKPWPTGITSIMEDRVGQVWISASEGFFCFQPSQQELRKIAIANVVPDRQIHAILEGKPGDLWLTSNYGLVQFRNGNLRRVYGPSAGLQSREFIQGAAFQTAGGILYAGGPKGYNRFDPHFDFQQPKPPPVVLTSLRVMGQEVEIDLNEGLVLEPDERFFTIEYSALDYKAANTTRYAYKLDAGEAAWSFVDNQRYLSFSNLSGGNYYLRVQAANGEGVWNQSQLEIPIVVNPPFWQTSSFKFSVFLAIFLIVIIVLQYRVRHLRHRQIALQREADESTKSLYEAHARLAEDAHKAGVAEISTGVLHNIGNILNSVTVSTNSLRRILVQTKLVNFQKAVKMTEEIQERPSEFFKDSRRGVLLAEFFQGAEAAIAKENANLHEETIALLDQIALMGKAVSLEQSYANRFDKKAKVNMAELVDNAVRLQEMTLKKRNIELFKSYSEVSHCNVETYKLAHVITNLVRNAADALLEVTSPPEGRRIIVSVEQTKPSFVQVAVADNGVGIAPENLARMFSFGFTTKAHGNGFGLHSSHAIMEELGGSIEVESDGLGKGACFVLQVPLESHTKEAE